MTTPTPSDEFYKEYLSLMEYCRHNQEAEDRLRRLLRLYSEKDYSGKEAKAQFLARLEKDMINILEEYSSEYSDFIIGVQETEEDFDRTLNNYIRKIKEEIANMRTDVLNSSVLTHPQKLNTPQPSTAKGKTDKRMDLGTSGDCSGETHSQGFRANYGKEQTISSDILNSNEICENCGQTKEEHYGLKEELYCECLDWYDQNSKKFKPKGDGA